MCSMAGSRDGRGDRISRTPHSRDQPALTGAKPDGGRKQRRPPYRGGHPRPYLTDHDRDNEGDLDSKALRPYGHCLLILPKLIYISIRA